MQFFCLFVSLFFLALACKRTPSHESCDVPSGRFINTTVLKQCPDAMPADIPHYALELTFSEPGQVLVNNGFEKYALPYVGTDYTCRFMIAKATQFGDMFFQVESDSMIQLIDSAWTKLESSTEFFRTAHPLKADWNFERHLNDCLIAGEYGLYKDGRKVEGRVTLLDNGQMDGLRPYISYRICYAGDCLEETDPPAQTIVLMDNHGKTETFVMRTSDGKKSIKLYAISDPLPDVKGEREIGELVYEWRQQ